MPNELWVCEPCDGLRVKTNDGQHVTAGFYKNGFDLGLVKISIYSYDKWLGGGDIWINGDKFLA